MTHVLRFGVSMDAELLTAFDQLINRKGYANRSEALRDLVRQSLIESQWSQADQPTVAVLCVVCDRSADPLARLTELQSGFTDQVLSTLRMPMDQRQHLVVMVLRGLAGRLESFSNRVLATRGVIHGQLVMTGAGTDSGSSSAPAGS